MLTAFGVRKWSFYAQMHKLEHGREKIDFPAEKGHFFPKKPYFFPEFN
jgi:hypothetical protein